jgi:hypothetical protein
VLLALDCANESRIADPEVLGRVPLSIDIDQLEDAQTSAGARAQLKEAIRLYFRRVLGK